MSMRAAALLVGALISASAAPAWAAEDPWAGLEVVEDEALANLRGGVRLDNGLEVGLGAVVSTYANGALVLQTQLTWTEAGAVVEETLGALGQNINSLSPEARAILGVDPSAGGVVLADSAGVTALIHNVTNGSLQNIIINNASGRDLEQRIDVTLSLPNFDAMQNVFSLQHLGLALDRDISSALAGF